MTRLTSWLHSLILRAVTRYLELKLEMATTRVIALTHYMYDEDTQSIIPAIQKAVSDQTVTWSDLTPQDVPQIGGVALVFGFYRSANKLSTLTLGLHPTIAPAASRHSVLATKVEGGDPDDFVYNFEEVIGAESRTALLDWLAQWYPDVRNTVATLITAQVTRIEAAYQLLKAIKPDSTIASAQDLLNEINQAVG